MNLPIYLLAVIGLTAVAVYTDLRFRKIPNWLTIPFFFLGWVYQGYFRGTEGLTDGLAGFALGFGTYFALWMVAGGGGGDAKLAGALSVWLGFRSMLLVMVLSTLLVVLDAAVVLFYRVARDGLRGLKKQYALRETSDTRGKPELAEGAARAQRRIVPFAVPLGLATWLLTALSVYGRLSHGRPWG